MEMDTEHSKIVMHLSAFVVYALMLSSVEGLFCGNVMWLWIVFYDVVFKKSVRARVTKNREQQ